MEIHEELVIIVANGTYLIFCFMCDKKWLFPTCIYITKGSSDCKHTGSHKHCSYPVTCYIFSDYPSYFLSQVPAPPEVSSPLHGPPGRLHTLPGPLHGPSVPARPAGRHAHAELHFYITRLHSAYTSIESSSSPSCPAVPPALYPLHWEKGALPPQGKERWKRWPWNHRKFNHWQITVTTNSP